MEWDRLRISIPGLGGFRGRSSPFLEMGNVYQQV
jgi:hypothetical protein